MIKRWLFKKDIADVDRMLKKLESVEAMYGFFIEQGRKTTQYQINNPDRPIPRTLMGHGLQIGADHLRVLDKQWQRAYAHETRQLMEKLNNHNHRKG